MLLFFFDVLYIQTKSHKKKQVSVCFNLIFVTFTSLSFVVLCCTQQQELVFQLGKVMPIDQATPADLAYSILKLSLQKKADCCLLFKIFIVFKNF
jgi:hypothetical protein